MTFKGPYPIEHIIGGGSDGKTNGIGNVFLKFQILLAKKCNGKVNQNSRKSYDPKFDEFVEKNGRKAIIQSRYN